MELTIIQMLLIGSLILIVPIGLYNQILRKKKKQEAEKLYANSNNSNVSNEDYSNDTIKNYISQYKGTYSKDAIKSALVNAGNSESEVERYLNKFF